MSLRRTHSWNPLESCSPALGPLPRPCCWSCGLPFPANRVPGPHTTTLVCAFLLTSPEPLGILFPTPFPVLNVSPAVLPFLQLLSPDSGSALLVHSSIQSRFWFIPSLIQEVLIEPLF